MILKDRPLVSWRSRNRGTGSKPRIYSRAALTDLAPRLEGESIFLNHSDDPAKGRRRFEDLIGRAINVRVADTGLRGDIELSDFHPEAKRIADHVDKKLPLGGISLDAIVEGASVDGSEVVTRINRLYSLDFVAEPAGFHISEEEAKAPLTEAEKALVEMTYVPKTDFDSLKASHDALVTRIAAIESVQKTPPARAPEPPPAPPYTPQAARPTADVISTLIKNCRE